MSDIIKMENIQDLIFEIRGVKVILDSNVADLYGVETRDINKAVRNNPDKFLDSYVFELNKVEFEDLRWKISTAKFTNTETSIGINFAVLKFKHTIKKKGK